MMSYFIGLMSGTSMDAIDAVLVSFDHKAPTILGTIATPMPKKIKSALTTLCQSTHCDIRMLGETDTQLGILFSKTCLQLLENTGVLASDIIAIGSHGQTIYHQPNHEHAFTLQIGDPNIIAARTNITTVADFRRRDIALGGQGAPLVPAFHAYLFDKKNEDQWVLNIGGIANLTFLPGAQTQSIMGFDTGPGNTLLDLWHEKHRQIPIDCEGAWAKSGTIHSTLLTHFLNDAYFQKSPPKSTGREYFHLNWLDEKLNSFTENVTPADIQATLTELTAKSIADGILNITSQPSTLWTCGGGVYNNFLMERIRTHLPGFQVFSTSQMGIDPKWIEATAFAWLAKQTIEKKSGNLPSVTGAIRESILGAVYYA